MSGVNANHLASQQGGGTPQAANHFALEVQGLPGWEDVILALDNSNAPNEVTEELELKYGNETRFYAGPTTFEAMTLTVRDFVDSQVMAVLEAWRNSVFNPDTGETGYPSEYKKTATFILMDGKGNVTKEWPLEGVWPTSLNRGAVSQEDSTALKVEVNLRYDKMLRPTVTKRG